MTAVVTTQVDLTSGQPTEQMQTHGAAHVTIIPRSAEIMIVGANANFTINPGLLGRHFENGIVICNSSTGPTKTIDGANCWIDVRYA